jgi:hypothetical protein
VTERHSMAHAKHFTTQPQRPAAQTYTAWKAPWHCQRPLQGPPWPAYLSKHTSLEQPLHIDILDTWPKARPDVIAEPDVNAEPKLNMHRSSLMQAQACMQTAVQQNC